MIILTDDEVQMIVSALSATALRRLKKAGIPFDPPPPFVDEQAVLSVQDETVVVDDDGHIWLATRPCPSEVWLSPFDDRMAFQIIGQPGGKPPRTHTVHPGAVPAFPLTVLSIP